MDIKYRKKVLITLKEGFYAPDGVQYKAVFGVIKYEAFGISRIGSIIILNDNIISYIETDTCVNLALANEKPIYFADKAASQEKEEESVYES